MVMLRVEMFPFEMVIGAEPGLVKVRFSGWLVPGYRSAVRFPPTVKFRVETLIVQQNLVAGPAWPDRSVA
jgi:hypothetical protein